MIGRAPKRLEAMVKAAKQLIEADPKKSSAVKMALVEFQRQYIPGITDFSKGPSDRLLEAGYKLSDALSLQVNQTRFTASVAISPDRSAGQVSEKTIRIVARTGDVAVHGHWGRVVNNMAGFVQPTGPVVLDFGHNDSEIVGVADRLEIVGNQLIATGRLVPFTPDDMASEIIHKGSSGVPYQASVTLDPTLCEIQRIGEGESVMVNGSLFVGPGVVFTQWGIAGIAILAYGADSSTSVEFSRPLDSPHTTASGRALSKLEKHISAQMAGTLVKTQKSDKSHFGGVPVTVPKTTQNNGRSSAMSRYTASVQRQIDASKRR